MTGYIPLEKLEVYQLSRELSKKAWQIYEALSWPDKKNMGDQFIRSVDSVGANIAEGYRRYHYLERIKFYYISRASLSEACHHWLDLLLERQKISRELFEGIKTIESKLAIKLTNFINVSYQAKRNDE
jgi:four helix bundle protein